MKILEPIKIKNIHFKNRVVMAPMVVFGLPKTENGHMGPDLLLHYFNRAGTGIGLIIFQSAAVTSKGLLYNGHGGLGGIGIFLDEHIPNMKKLADICHENNTKFFVQLSYPTVGFAGGASILNISEDDLEEIKNDFVNAARRCKQAGCDGVEIHGAHGFFLNMFSSPISNNRKDQYGGSINRRMLLAKNIIEEIKDFSDENFIISYRMGWNDTLDTDIKTAQFLENAGVEMLHISSGIPITRAMELPDNFEFNNIVYTASQVREHIHIPVIAVNDIQTIHRGNYLIENDFCDFAAFGKPFLADQDFMIRSMENNDYKACFRCKNCQWFVDGRKCPAVIQRKRLA